jgi:hypothetical protein
MNYITNGSYIRKGLASTVDLAAPPRFDVDPPHASPQQGRHPPRGLVATESWQTEVDEHHFGMARPRDLDALGSVLGHRYAMPACKRTRRISRASGLSSTTRMWRQGPALCSVASSGCVGEGVASGSRTTTSLPRPSPSLWIVTVPPWSSTSLRTSVRPIPNPPWERASKARRQGPPGRPSG